MKVKIFFIWDSHKHFDQAINEYLKRLWSSCQTIGLKPYKHGNRKDIITKETTLIINHLKKIWSDWMTVLCSLNGNSYTTEQLVSQRSGKQIAFVIGWPYGVDEALLIKSLPHITKRQLGAHTLPHGLALLTIVEQIYRIQQINAWREYHY